MSFFDLLIPSTRPIRRRDVFLCELRVYAISIFAHVGLLGFLFLTPPAPPLDSNVLVQVRPVTETELMKNRKEFEIVPLTHAKSLALPKDPRFLSEKTTSTDEEVTAIRRSHDPFSGAFQKETFSLEKEGLGQEQTAKSISKEPGKTGQPGDEEIMAKGVKKVGEKTLLNAVEFVHAGYFNRIKRRVEDVWSPMGTIQGVDLSKIDQVATVVSFTLRADGSLLECNVVRSSGIRAFDEEALRSLRVAAPFANPPAALLGPDGFVRFPEWTFVLFTSRWIYWIY